MIDIIADSYLLPSLVSQMINLELSRLLFHRGRVIDWDHQALQDIRKQCFYDSEIACKSSSLFNECLVDLTQDNIMRMYEKAPFYPITPKGMTRNKLGVYKAKKQNGTHSINIPFNACNYKAFMRCIFKEFEKYPSFEMEILNTKGMYTQYSFGQGQSLVLHVDESVNKITNKRPSDDGRILVQRKIYREPNTPISFASDRSTLRIHMARLSIRNFWYICCNDYADCDININTGTCTAVASSPSQLGSLPPSHLTLLNIPWNVENMFLSILYDCFVPNVELMSNEEVNNMYKNNARCFVPVCNRALCINTRPAFYITQTQNYVCYNCWCFNMNIDPRLLKMHVMRCDSNAIMNHRGDLNNILLIKFNEGEATEIKKNNKIIGYRMDPYMIVNDINDILDYPLDGITTILYKKKAFINDEKLPNIPSIFK